MVKINKKFKVKLNSPEKIEELLQELYDEADSNIVALQNEINKLTNSINLQDEIVDSKAKYAKAMNDYIINKDKSIGRKLEIAKLMTEIYKHGGNNDVEFLNNQIPDDWQETIENIETKNNKNFTSTMAEEYKIK